MEKIVVPGENHQPLASHWQTLLHNVVLSTPRHERGSNWQLVIGTEWTDSCKFNYHATTPAPTVLCFKLGCYIFLGVIILSERNFSVKFLIYSIQHNSCTLDVIVTKKVLAFHFNVNTWRDHIQVVHYLQCLCTI